MTAHMSCFWRHKKPVDDTTYSDDSIWPNIELQAVLYGMLRIGTWQSQKLLWKFFTSPILKEMKAF